MKEREIFKILILIARPAAGKSEIIDYLKRTNIGERKRRFHIGDIEEIDDFPMLWTWFEEDKILAEMRKPRLHTDDDGYFKYKYLWDLLIRRICLEYNKLKERTPCYHEQYTSIIEFARGLEHGGFYRAFQNLSEEVLAQAVVLYIEVSYEESLKKNKRRYNPKQPDSVLEHSLPESKMRTLYKEIDWKSFSEPDPHYLYVKRIRIPYAVMENEDDVTTQQGEALGLRLEAVLSRLWSLYIKGN
jgi:hypothetical protein